MKSKKAWILQKIQVQGIADDTLYPAGRWITFIASEPYVPVFEQCKKEDVALSLVRHEEAWWIVNHSEELCCAVNEQMMEPHHRMRLNDGDTIEWGLSSWCLARHDTIPQPFRPDAPKPQPVPSLDATTEYLDLDWFRQQRLNPQNPFDIIPVRDTSFSDEGVDTDNPLTLLYQEYQKVLLSPGQETRRRTELFPQHGGAGVQPLTALYDQKADIDTLQDMVAATPGIDAILNTLDSTSEGELAWLVEEPLSDILHLLSPDLARNTAHNDILPDLTQREHRIIGIDSHYRINLAHKNGDASHEKN